MCYGISTKQERIKAATERLNKAAENWKKNEPNAIGYPINQEPDMKEFYKWYVASNIPDISMNNVGNPSNDSPYNLHSHEFESEVVAYFAKLYGFDPKQHWGFVTDSGTDGNNHGIYFGRKKLKSKSPLEPIIYVSEEAHYSIKKLADVQNTELKLIKALPMGQMDIQDFEKNLNSHRPALVVIAIGTTFKGAMDNQIEIQKILKKKKPPAFYIHLDAALFGGFLPYLKGDVKNIVSQKIMGFDSIAVSGHKFFGFDNPMGIFVTTKNVFEHINPFRVEYLAGAVPTISCSRSALASLKFWWKLNTVAPDFFAKEAASLIANAIYLHNNLRKSGIRAWRNNHSNTVFFARPSEAIMKKYSLAGEVSKEFGALAHIVVMQHVDKEKIDQFISDISKM